VAQVYQGWYPDGGWVAGTHGFRSAEFELYNCSVNSKENLLFMSSNLNLFNFWPPVLVSPITCLSTWFILPSIVDLETHFIAFLLFRFESGGKFLSLPVLI
jgi:hypothetical protein